MKAKKLTALILGMTMLAATITGCGGSENGNAGAGGASESSGAEVSSDGPITLTFFIYRKQ